jgi:TolB protein
MRRRAVTILGLWLAVMAAACTSTSGDRATGDGAADPAGLLVVSRADSAIFTIKPDGSDRTDLVVERAGLAAVQPTWSLDGERLVWTEVDHMSEIPEAFIVTSGPRGDQLERVESGTAPFYYSWSPTGDTIAFLGGGPGGQVDLGLLDDEVRLLGGAQPYYFAWAPDGQSLLTHTNGMETAFLSTDGTGTSLDSTPARFQAPQWSGDGTRVVYATGSPPPTGGVRTGAFQSGGQEIVVAEPGGDILQRLGAFSGVATFDLGPGSLIAHSVTLERTVFNYGPLVVTDLESGDETTVSQEPVLAYQWSPTGDALLYLGSRGGIDHPTFKWFVWDGTASTEYAVVTPTPVFATSYLPFWDQYARSHTVWAPDGSAFAYSGLNEEGEPTVWVQTIGTQEPTEVARGDVVFWSPDPG